MYTGVCGGCHSNGRQPKAASAHPARSERAAVQWERVFGERRYESAAADQAAGGAGAAGEEIIYPAEICRLPEPYVGSGGWGQPLGKFKLTHYWVVSEVECSGPPEVEIYDSRGRVIALVSEEFACKLGLEGSGRLADGRVVNYWGSGDHCVRTTACRRPYYPSRNCYKVLDVRRYYHGKGVWRRALTPYKSIATDPYVIPFGTIVYLPAYDGYVLPDGTVHDGCVRSDDTGGAIVGDHLDFFSGTEWSWRMMRRHFPRKIDVFINPPRCNPYREWFEAVGAGCCEDRDCPYADGVCLGDSHFPGGYCSLPTCAGHDCPDVGGYFAFCTDYFSGGTCVQRCFEDQDCRPNYVCREVFDMGGGTGMACIPR
jgi:3D (Asp-Asp-Asp) domain-containing protein